MRVFEAPRNFIGNLQRISQVELVLVCLMLHLRLNQCFDIVLALFSFPIPIPQASEDLPLGATVPSLGLSNKAIFKSTDASEDSGGGQKGGAAKNAFGDNVPVFTSVDLDSELPFSE